jgi:bifunctional DNA-binding transcriptional regulator/antitoxin component of YhaV-PrlF toxin-antitoxin module
MFAKIKAKLPDAPSAYCSKELDLNQMPKAAKKQTFTTVLTKFAPESGWHYITVSPEIADGFRFEKGSRRVICTLNGKETIQAALMPYDGAYFIMVNKGVRARLGIEPGDTLSVEIEKDESRYGLPMPAELQEVLNEDAEGDRLFHLLTPGKQRSMLYFIGKFKDIDKRIHTSLIFIEHLKKNDGKLIHDELHQELKRPAF